MQPLKHSAPDENTTPYIEEGLLEKAHVAFNVEEESSSEESVDCPTTRKREREDGRDCDFLIRKMSQLAFVEKLVLNEVSWCIHIVSGLLCLAML